MSLAALLAAALLAAAPGAAAKKPKPKAASPNAPAVRPAQLTEPVLINAEKLEVFGKERRAIYIGNAVAVRGATTIKSDQFTVYYSDTGNDVTRLVAEGHVVIVDGDRRAKGDRADFDNLTGVAVLTGKPEAQLGATHVTGSLVTFTMGTDTVQVENARTLLDESRANKVGDKQPVRIDAEKLTGYGKEKRAVWTGRVRARKGDALITANRLVANYNDLEELTHAEAIGNVEVEERDRWARGDKADFDNRKGVLVVTGNPQARQGPNRMKGDRVTFTLGSERLEVEKAETVIQTEGRRP